ncbi:MAG: mechanosensitive ion channel [Deltaproteobacteria bacterium]|nr:mechanosensitive ion channel [Deltaproteobacteria bacterium]
MSFETTLKTLKGMLDSNLLTLAGTPISLATAITFFVAIFASVHGSKYLANMFGRSDLVKHFVDVNTSVGLQRFIRVALLWLGLAFSFAFLGVDLAALFTAGAVFAVGIGFALQNIARDLISGLLLGVERKIKSGDILLVNDQLVRVMEMGVRSSLVRTLNEEDIILPNTQLISNTVTNYTYSDSLLRVRAQVVTSYEADLATVMSTIQEAAASLPKQVDEHPPRVLLVGFSERGVCFDVSIWMNDPWALPRFQSDLYEAVWWALQEQGLKVAHPQLDISVKTPLQMKSSPGFRNLAEVHDAPALS